MFWCWLKGRFGGASLLMDGGGGVGGVLVEGVFRWRVGGGVFWCWLKGRFGGASLLMDGGGVLVEGAF